MVSEQAKPERLCIGQGCSKETLPDSVYCSAACILQHAAVTMKSEKGRRRERAAELEFNMEDEDVKDLNLVNQQALQEWHEQQRPESNSGAADVLYSDSPAKELSTGSDPLVMNSDLDLSADRTRGQYDNKAVDDRRFEKEKSHRVFDSEGSDPDALYCICRQKHNKRYVLVASQKQNIFPQLQNPSLLPFLLWCPRRRLGS